MKMFFLMFSIKQKQFDTDKWVFFLLFFLCWSNEKNKFWSLIVINHCILLSMYTRSIHCKLSNIEQKTEAKWGNLIWSIENGKEKYEQKPEYCYCIKIKKTWFQVEIFNKIIIFFFSDELKMDTKRIKINYKLLYCCNF